MTRSAPPRRSQLSSWCCPLRRTASLTEAWRSPFHMTPLREHAARSVDPNPTEHTPRSAPALRCLSSPRLAFTPAPALRGPCSAVLGSALCRIFSGQPRWQAANLANRANGEPASDSRADRAASQASRVAFWWGRCRFRLGSVRERSGAHRLVFGSVQCRAVPSQSVLSTGATLVLTLLRSCSAAEGLLWRGVARRSSQG